MKKKLKGAVFKWRCLMAQHYLFRGEKYAKTFIRKIDRRKKIKWVVCEKCAEFREKMMKRRLRGL